MRKIHGSTIGLLTVVGIYLSGSSAYAQAWVQLSPTGTTPPPVFGHTSVYDPGTNRMIIFAGATGNDQSLDQVWVLTNANGIGGGSAWTQLLPTGPPPPRRGFHTAVYDPGNNRMTIFGGFHGGASEIAFNDAWVLTNANGLGGTPQWLQLSPTGAAPNRAEHTAIYDSATNRMTIFAGCSGNPTNCGSFLQNSIWTLINANGLGGTPQWVQLSPSGAIPPAGTLKSATYDPASNRMTVFGGASSNAAYVLTNANGLGGIPQWIQLSPTGSLPPGRNSHKAVYRAATNRMTIFSGFSGAQVNDVWVLSNANGLSGAPTWTQILASGSPPLGREASAAVYDPATNRMIVFGGINSPNGLKDVWVLLNADGVVPAPLGLVQSLPNIGGNAGQVTVRVIGSGFQSGASLKLTGLGPDILGTNTAVSDASVLTTTFNLRGVTPGTRTVVVTKLDDTAASLPSGFRVEQGGAPQIWVDIIGRDRVRIGRAQTFYVSYGNRGNIDAAGVPLWIQAPEALQLTPSFDVEPIPPLNMNTPTQPPNAAIEVLALSSNQDPSEIVLGDQQALPLLVRQVSAGSSGWLPITLAASSAVAPFDLEAWVNPPWITEITALTATGDDDAKRCVASIIVTALGWNIGTEATLAVAWYQAMQGMVLRDLGAGHFPVSDKLAFFMALIQDAIRKDSTLPVPASLQTAATNALSLFNTAAACASVSRRIEHKKITLQSVFSLDPNLKTGSQGTGVTRFIAGAEPLRYLVEFENKDTATAPAQQVFITDQLDSVNLDLNTFTLGPMLFGSTQVLPTLGVASYATTLDLRPAKNLLVRISAILNKTTGLLTWSFTSLDPVTGLPPADPLAGFLPPGVGGSVFYTVMPRNGASTGTQIRNTASIVFDTNAPILTPEWSNTIDNTKPTSHTNPLPAQSPPNFPVQWTGSDVGSGIQSFNVYVSDNGGSFAPWLSQTTSTQASYSGVTGHTYSFYSLAKDQTGNIEAPKTLGEASTTASCAASVTSSVTVTRGGFRLNNASQRYVQSIVLKNISASSIAGPVFLVLDGLSTSATLFNPNGTTACVAPLGSPFFNVNIATLAPGGTATAVLEFTNPSNQGITYTTRILHAAGTK